MIQRPVRLASAGLLTAIALVSGSANSQQQPSTQMFDPVGRWRFHHTDGTPFTARLTADQTAATDWEGGERGIWRWENGKVRMIYTDGWDDLVSLQPDGRFVKQGWSPDANRCDPASNETQAERLSNDPGSPL